MRYMMRYILLVAALAAAAFGYTLYWHKLADHLTHATGEWITQRRAEGYVIATTGYKVSGFPDQLVLTIDQPTIAKPADPHAWSMSAARVTLYAQPWNFHHVIVDFGHSQTFAWKDGGIAHKAALNEGDAKTSLFFSSAGAITALDLALSDATLTADRLAGPLQAKRFELHERKNHGETKARPKGSIDLAFGGTDILLPPDPNLTLGRQLADVVVQVTLPPPLPQSLKTMAAWRDDGGTVELDRLKLDWGPLDVQGSGTLALDREMRPLAALTADIRGFGPALDAIAAAGRIKPGNVALAKAVLNALATTDKQGDRSIRVPVTAQNGKLFVGPVKLLTLAPLPLLSGQSPAG